jgi:hypothetical protein
MRVPDTSFVHRMDMTVRERLTVVEGELGRAIQRESRRAMEVSSFDEMMDEVIAELREIAELKLCSGPVRRRMIALALRTEKDIKGIFDGREYERRKRRADD